MSRVRVPEGVPPHWVWETPNGEPKQKARWSSGQDGGLSRRKQEFDSPTGHHSFLGLDMRQKIEYNLIAFEER